MPWTEDKVEKLRELWDQGLPTSQIGKILDFTKNAVVGKAHRIGLERRPSPIKRNIMKPDRKKARAPEIPNLSVNLKSDNDFDSTFIPKINYDKVAKDNLGNDLFFIKKNTGCEWPIGHPDESNFRYCGSEKVESKPYCAEHCSKAYVVADKVSSKEEVAA